MKKLFIFFIISLFISACTLKKVEKHHGVHFLNKKQEKLTVNQSNKNDILELLGSPSTKSTFDNDLWIYIERKTDTAFLRKFGNEKIDSFFKKGDKFDFKESDKTIPLSNLVIKNLKKSFLTPLNNLYCCFK